MKRLIAIAVLVVASVPAVAQLVKGLCPYHPYSYCHDAHLQKQVSPGVWYEKWSCTCGDDVWVAK